MIVIKCNDCGNILNQNDMICNKCGCPIENNTKRFCSICGDEIKDGELTCNRCNNSNNNEKLDYIIRTDRNRSLKVFFIIFDILSIMLLPIFFLLFLGFALFGFNLPKLIKENYRNSYMVLKDKEIYGEFYAIFKVNKISFPLNKISSIRTIKLFGIINAVSIVADSGKNIRFFFVDNAEYFRKEVIKQINKNV